MRNPFVIAAVSVLGALAIMVFIGLLLTPVVRPSNIKVTMDGLTVAQVVETLNALTPGKYEGGAIAGGHPVDLAYDTATHTVVITVLPEAK